MPFWTNFRPVHKTAVRRTVVAISAVILLGTFVVEVFMAARDLSAIWDEPHHLLAGYRYWQAGDYGINPEHPPLAKLIGTFPLLFMHLKVPRVGLNVTKPMANVLGRAFVYKNDADTLLLRARLAESVMGLILILLLFEAGYRMFAPGAACIAVLLAVFEPNLLAHSTLVTTDFALTCFFFAAVYAFWRVAEQPTWWRLLGCGFMTGLTLAAKHSGILLIPTLLLLAALEVICAGRGDAALRQAQGGERSQTARRPHASAAFISRQLCTWLGRVAIVYASALIILWSFYGFRYQSRPGGLVLPLSLAGFLQNLSGHLAPRLIATCARLKLLPESYLFGLVDVLAVTAGPRISFLLGHLYPSARWYYFPVAFVIKSTLGFLGLLLLSVTTVKNWSGGKCEAARRSAQAECRSAPRLAGRKAAYVLLPPLLFLGVSMTAGTNMGIRHVLPIYPFFILAAAAGAYALIRRPASRRPAMPVPTRARLWAAGRHQVWSFVVVALLGIHIASSLHTLPDYLAYSNELFGGTSRTYRALSDSNADWGQGLREARQYLARRNIKECWLAYFGSADPAYYHLPCKMLPDPFLKWWGLPIPVPPEQYHGVVLIGGTEIAAPYWGSEMLNPYSQFLYAQPTANIGGSLVVFEGNVDLRRPSAFGHMYKAWELIAAQQQEAAIQEILKAEDLLPDHPAPRYMLGYVLARANRPEAARLQFEEAVKLAKAAHPEFGQFWMFAAQAELALLP